MPHLPCEPFPIQLPRDLAPATVLEHQWRTPLTVIRSAAEVLRDHQDLTPLERNQLLDALLVEAARLHVFLEAQLSRNPADADWFTGFRR